MSLDKKDGVGFLLLNRPEVRNAFNQVMIDEIRESLECIRKDKEIRVLIVTGAGKAFQAGADIAELRRMSPLELLRWNDGIVRINAALESLPQPVIAAINGAAMGGGLELALACTIRVMEESAKIGLPEVKLGIIPGTGGTIRLPRLIGIGRAAKLILTGDPIGAKDALELGLVDEIVPDGSVLKAAEDLARRIISNAPIAVELAKDAIMIGRDLPIEHAVQYSQKNCVACFSTEDMKEGTSAFLEKRKPRFVGR
ncbi:MAG: crotonase [Deltaproteobacteria bacterium]|nr:MAG: crotonase [Deltaproteobacteria bacterium]